MAIIGQEHGVMSTNVDISHLLSYLISPFFGSADSSLPPVAASGSEVW